MKHLAVNLTCTDDPGETVSSCQGVMSHVSAYLIQHSRSTARKVRTPKQQHSFRRASCINSRFLNRFINLA
jgi:hypothetical protein